MLQGLLRNPPAAVRLPLFIALAFTAACAPKGDALYTRAEQSLTKGEVSAAVIDLKNLVESDPQNAKARALLGLALVQSGDIQAGEIEIKKAEALGAPRDLILVPRCKVLAAKGEFDKVLAECKPELAPAPAQADLHLVYGKALLGLERAGEAKGQFEAALAAKPDSAEAVLGLAAAAYATDGLPAARAVLAKAPESVKNQARYWLTMGSVASAGGDYPAAEKAFSTALERAQQSGRGTEQLEALSGLTDAQLRAGKVKEATETSEKLLKAAPDSPYARLVRGQVLAAAGKYDEARTVLEQVVSAEPKNARARTLLGLVNLQQGKLGQAEMNFSNVVANDPKDVRAQRLLAETRSRVQSPAQTLDGLKPALEQPDADPSLLAMAGRLSLASGNREQALSYLAQAAGQDGQAQTPEVQLEIASGFLMAGDLERAVQLLEAMPQGGATGYQREYLLMVALLRSGQKDKAVAEGKALIERSGDDPAMRNLVASVYAAAGQADAGREQFNAALKLKPNDPQTLLNLARLDLAEGKTTDAAKNFGRILEGDPKNLIATLGAAVAAGSGGDFKGAEKWLLKAVADHPESAEARLALAQFYIGRREFGKARAVMDEADKKAPGNAAFANMRGLAMLGANDVPGALASFAAAMKLAPNVVGYALNLARAHIVNRDLNSALGVLNGVLKTDPKSQPALILAAAATIQAGDLEKAAGYVERLRQAAPESLATYTLEGDLAMAQKRYREALQFYQKASAQGANRELVMAQYRASLLSGVAQPEKVVEDWVAEHPGDIEAVAALAEARQRKGDVKGAIEVYERGLVKAPDNAILLNNLAVLYQDKADPRAVETAAKAYANAPLAPAVQDTYGWILLNNGNADKAVELLAQAFKGLPDNAEVQYHYAAALAKKGDKAAALPILSKAVKGQLPADQKAAAQKLLEQLSR